MHQESLSRVSGGVDAKFTARSSRRRTFKEGRRWEFLKIRRGKLEPKSQQASATCATSQTPQGSVVDIGAPPRLKLPRKGERAMPKSQSTHRLLAMDSARIGLLGEVTACTTSLHRQK